MIFKLSYLNSNLTLTRDYLNPALNNSAQNYRKNDDKIVRNLNISYLHFYLLRKGLTCKVVRLQAWGWTRSVYTL